MLVARTHARTEGAHGCKAVHYTQSLLTAAADVLTIENSRSGDEMIAALASYGYRRDLGATMCQLMIDSYMAHLHGTSRQRHITIGQRQATTCAVTGDMHVDLCGVIVWTLRARMPACQP